MAYCDRPCHLIPRVRIHTKPLQTCSEKKPDLAIKCYHLISYLLLLYSRLLSGVIVDKRIVQVNIRTSAETAERLKAIADQGNMTLGALIEKMLASYQSDSSVIASGDDWRDALAKLRDELDKRLAAIELATDHNSKAVSDFHIAVNALETRLEALETTDRGRVAPKQKAAKIGLESAVEPSSIPPKVFNDDGRDGKEPAKYAIRNAAIVELHAAGLTISKISAALAERGIVSREGNPLNPGTICTVMKRLGLSATGKAIVD